MISSIISDDLSGFNPIHYRSSWRQARGLQPASPSATPQHPQRIHATIPFARGSGVNAALQGREYLKVGIWVAGVAAGGEQEQIHDAPF